MGEPATSNWRIRAGGLARYVETRVPRVERLRSSEKGSSMPIIRANARVITQINVFTVPQGGQQALIDHLSDAARFVRDTPGWVSASLHRSLDGTKVVNYAQAEGHEAARRIIDRLRQGGFLDHKGLGEASPGLYEVAYTLER
ncbi:antibiotic biosynthesis monooxygenase [Mesorhizobium sp. WSM4935]|uniref:antibiotic biosynthesis monooxygenase family protein n=1 Tax=Mesorhizobium sp. WSM4935 TaxID=3038547 RepID=UPI0024151212|nr:antibiotic biosynthesis monooxygenase [Mesorhizobium sp. WSM4935]MDG4875262.1 antibiotic biosynthesis monooxygenase [Mesorhizobium sp. WSM4935]